MLVIYGMHACSPVLSTFLQLGAGEVVGRVGGCVVGVCGWIGHGSPSATSLSILAVRKQ